MGSCCSAREGKQHECFYGLVAGTLKVSAQVVPRSVRAIRFVCDTRVPTFLLSKGVQVQGEVLEQPWGSLQLEWVMPMPAKDCESPSRFPAPITSLFADNAAAPSDFSRIMLYLHGGAYVLCTPGSLRGVTSPLARTTGAALCVPDYRRPPECPIDSALEDCMAAYRHLVKQYPHAELYLGGESAGGGLAASMLALLRDSDLPLPKAVLLMSPWTDLGGDGGRAGLTNASLENEKFDYLPLDLITMFAECARGDLPHDSATVSPVHASGSLESLPPIFVLYGANEVLRGQIEHFCRVWREKGAQVRQHGVQGGVHAPVLFHFCHDSSCKALSELREFFSGSDQV